MPRLLSVSLRLQHKKQFIIIIVDLSLREEEHYQNP